MSGYRDAYYLKSMRVRTKLINEFNNAFKRFDVLVFPTMPVVAPRFDEIEKLSPLQNFAMDLCTVPSNLAGLPHLSINVGFVDSGASDSGSVKKVPVGLMIVAPHLGEDKLYSLGKVIEGE